MTSQIHIDRALPVTSRDGVVLATDVYRPSREGSFPTLIYRVRGGRSSAFIAGVLLLNPLEAVDRGYAVVIQEVRGRAESDDRWQPFTHERNDSEDCLDWVVSQRWCDGRVGAYGTAYSAVGAMQMAALGRDELRAVAVLGTGADYHDGWIYTSGAFELGWNIYWAYMTLNESISRLDVSDEVRAELKARHSQAIIHAPEMAARLPLRDHPLLLEVGDTQYHEWLDHPDYDDYWQRVDLLTSADQMKTPVLSLIGWWDNFLSSHLDLYRAMTERSIEPARSHHRVVIGPWEHCNYVMSLSTNKTGDVEFGTPGAAGVGVSGPLVLDWFDRWVLGNDVGPSSGVRYWQVGADEWRETPSWPPPHDTVRWYFHSNGDASTIRCRWCAVDRGAGRQRRDRQLRLRPSRSDTDSRRQDAHADDHGGWYQGPHARGETPRRRDVHLGTVRGGTRDRRSGHRRTVGVVVGSRHRLHRPPRRCRSQRLLRGNRRRNRASSLPRINPFAFSALDAGRTHGVHASICGTSLTHSGQGIDYRVEIASCNFPRFDRNLNTSTGADPDVPFGSESLDDAVVATQLHRPRRVSSIVPRAPRDDLDDLSVPDRSEASVT